MHTLYTGVIVLQGGPGFFYLVEKVPVTPVKLRANETLLR